MVQSRKIALIALVARSLCGATGEIRPLHSSAYFSKDYFARPWKAYVLTPEGKRIYKLSFEPEYGPKNEVIGLDLVLVDAQRKQGPPVRIC